MRQVNTVKYSLIISFLFVGLTTKSAYAYNCENWVAKLQSTQGSVQVRQATKNMAGKHWVTVQRNATFCKGDVLRVQENSRAALLLRNDTLLRLNQNTTITFTDLSPDKPSVVSVSTGFAHFISRVKAAFEVITPFINAAIEGTEFVVAVNAGQTEVTVFEGTVRAYNHYGEVRLTANQTAQAKDGQAPIIILNVTPRDAVNWSLYYPVIIDSDANSLNAKASQALSAGQVEMATELLNQSIKENPNDSDALAMQSIIAIVQNQKDKGLKLAQQAVATNSKNTTAKLALSYAQQAHFKVGEALKTLQSATQNTDGTETDNSLVWSRLAEVYLMHGELDKALRAAKKANVPTLLQEQNSYAGLTNKILGKKADKICVAYDGMEQFFPKEKIVLTGNPVRSEVIKLEGKKERGIEFFDLKKEKKTLLIVGGSLGAWSINEAVEKAIPIWKEANIQVVWQTGKLFYNRAKNKTKGHESWLKVTEFISRMDLAYSVADLVVSRAGAIAVSELCLVKKPSIFVPLPSAAEDHQTKNAMVLTTLSAAHLIKDNQVREELGETVLKLISDEEELNRLSENISSLGYHDAADIIANEALKLINKWA